MRSLPSMTEGKREVNLRLKPAPQMNGFVYYSDGLTPQAGVLIEAIRKQDNQLTASTLTNRFGHFTLPHLLEGQYTLRISTPWGFEYFDEENLAIPDQSSLSISGNRSISNIEIKLPGFRKRIVDNVDYTGRPSPLRYPRTVYR